MAYKITTCHCGEDGVSFLRGTQRAIRSSPQSAEEKKKAKELAQLKKLQEKYGEK